MFKRKMVSVVLLLLQSERERDLVFQSSFNPGGGGGDSRGDSPLKTGGMLVVSPRGVNFGF